MSCDYFVYVCHDPLSFVIFDLGVYCLLFHLLFAYDGTSRIPLSGRFLPLFSLVRSSYVLFLLLL